MTHSKLRGVLALLLLSVRPALPGVVRGTAMQSAASGSTVTLPFFVTGPDGAPVQQVTAADITVTDDNQPARFVSAVLPSARLPLQLVLLVDSSGRQTSNPNYLPVVNAAKKFLQSALTTVQDRALVVTFAYTAQVTDWMNRGQASQFAFYLNPFGSSDLYDAIKLACTTMKNSVTWPARRVLVILTDGDDSGSLTSRDAAVRLAQDARALIFPFDTGPRGSRATEEHRRAVFREVAQASGGVAYFEPRPGDVPADFAAIQRLIDSIGLVTYVPASRGKPGQHHSVLLRATSNRNWSVNAARGYDGN
jgi:Ca-activated chloride channel homolog